MILKNKVIIITGGSGLIGREIIKDIISKGGIAINVDIKVNTDLENRTIHADITSEESINATIKLIYENFGKIDGLVNNAYPRTSDWGNSFEEINYLSWQKNVYLEVARHRIDTDNLSAEEVAAEVLTFLGSKSGSTTGEEKA